MNTQNTTLTLLGLILVSLFALSSCSVNQEEDTSAEESEVEPEVSESEHSEGAESGGEEHGNEGSGNGESGEESGTQYAKTDTYDETRNGARLVLNYDSETQAFTGTVENTTNETLDQVRVEVHLSNGTELGPTEPSDLEPGASMAVTLSAEDEEFDTWGAHPEVGESGSGEHGSEENHD